MQIVYLTIGIICLVMIFYGAKWLLRTKIIFSFPITEGIKQFTVKNKGTHSICVRKGYFEKSMKYILPILRNFSGDYMESKENFLKWRFRKKGIMYVEHSFFNASEIGTYCIESKISKQNELIMTKETVPATKKLLGILFFVFGINGSFWGIMLSINPNVLVQ